LTGNVLEPVVIIVQDTLLFNHSCLVEVHTQGLKLFEELWEYHVPYFSIKLSYA